MNNNEELKKKMEMPKLLGIMAHRSKNTSGGDLYVLLNFLEVI